MGHSMMKEEIKLKKRIAWLENAALGTQNSTQIQNYQRQANQTRNELASLKIQLAKKYPVYAQLKEQLYKLDFEIIRQKLLQSKDAVALEYFVGTEQSYLFQLSAEGETVITVSHVTTNLHFLGSAFDVHRHPHNHEIPDTCRSFFVDVSAFRICAATLL